MAAMTFHLLPNAHLDPVWLWDWREGLNEGIITTRTVLDLMDEFPDLTFMRGEAALYRHLEEHDPAAFRRLHPLAAGLHAGLAREFAALLGAFRCGGDAESGGALELWEQVRAAPPLPAIDNALRLSYNSSFRQAFVEWCTWNAHTGFRADPSRYYPEGAAFPLVAETAYDVPAGSRPVDVVSGCKLVRLAG